MNGKKNFKRCLILTIILLLLGTCVTSAFGKNIKISENKTQKSYEILETPESFVIEGIPYVGQTLGYCAYACFAMMLNAFEGINVSLNDVIYYTGVGYSFIYPSLEFDRIPGGGIYTSQQVEDTAFLGGLFGLNSNYWYPDTTQHSDEECWQEYWTRVKQNISEGSAIMTSVNSLLLSSVQSLIPFKIPNWLLKNFESAHAIVVFGYNETNQTVCYHDPMPNIVNRPECGTSQWMNISDFRKAVENTFTGSQNEGGSKYLVGAFRKKGDPLPKHEIFNKTHARNIEKLRGNLSAYDSFVVEAHDFKNLGINATIAYKNHLEKGLYNRIKTIFKYKIQGKLGISNTLKKIFLPIFAILLGYPPNSGARFYQTPFESIAIQKCYNSKFLKENKNFSNVCEYEAMLFKEEAKLWYKLGSFYSVFLRRGITLSGPRALLIITRMKNTLERIIEIEEALLNCNVNGGD